MKRWRKMEKNGLQCHKGLGGQDMGPQGPALGPLGLRC
jgi:hypothetical protein